MKKRQVIKLNEDLKAYASYFVSFLIERLTEKIENINQIILYGSVVRGTATKESDIDIFIDTEVEIEETINKILDKFYESRIYTLFRAKGIYNEINLKIGKLEDWEELHRSITSSGKVLWGDFKSTKTPVGTKHKILIYWDNIGKSRTSFLNKLYGFETKGKKVKGLLDKWNGKKTGKSSIIIPFKHKDKIFELLEEYKVNAKSIEVFSVE